MAGQTAKKQIGYAWTDYVTWNDDERWEIVGGEAFDMSPAPAVEHQRVVLRLAAAFHRYFAGKKCEVFVSPIDVKLSENDVVQPDIVVVCERSKVKPTHIDGAPTLVVEVLSPSTEMHDRLRKMALYARTGVKEVWLAIPSAALVEVFVLDGATYRLTGTYTKGDKLRSRAFPRMNVNLRHVFDFPVQTDEPVRVVREPGASYRTRPGSRPIRRGGSMADGMRARQPISGRQKRTA